MKIKEGRVKFVKPKRMLQIISNFEKLVFYFVSLQRVWCYDKVKSLVCIRSMPLLQGKHDIKSVLEWCNRLLINYLYRNSLDQWLFLENLKGGIKQNCADLRLIGNRNKLHSHESDVLSSLFRARQYWLASYTFQQPVSNIISLKTGACEVMIEYLKISLCWYRRFIKIFHNRINFPPTFSEDLRWWKGTQVQHHWNHNFKVIWRLKNGFFWSALHMSTLISSYIYEYWI